MSAYEKAIGWRPWYRMIQWGAVLVMFCPIGRIPDRVLSVTYASTGFCAFGVFTGRPLPIWRIP